MFCLTAPATISSPGVTASDTFVGVPPWVFDPKGVGVTFDTLSIEFANKGGKKIGYDRG